MTKKAVITNVSSGYASKETLNDNFEALNDNFDNTLSRDGSTPNQMEADFDLNSNDLLNGGRASFSELTLNGVGITPSTDLTQLASTSENGLMSFYDKAKSDTLRYSVDTLNDFVEDTQLTYVGTNGFAVDEGDYIWIGDLRYIVAASGATDHYRENTNGVKVYQDYREFSQANKSYDAGLMTVHPGSIWYNNDPDSKLYRCYSESFSHNPTFGMMVYLDFSDDRGGTWKSRRCVYPARTGRKVTATAGGYYNGRHVIVVNTEDSGGTRYLDLVYSDDNLVTWTTSSIPVTGAIDHFLYGGLNDYPTVAGGDDDDGFIFYTYVGSSTYAMRTSDKGATWTQSTLWSSTDTYNLLSGTPTTGYSATESTVAQVPGEAKFVHYLRGTNQRYYLVATSTDMITLENAAESGLENEGPSLETGNPPKLWTRRDQMTLYTFGRENWVDHDVRQESSLMKHQMPASDLYDANGIFSDLEPQFVMYLPVRHVGMMDITTIEDDVIAQVRAGETVFADGSHPVQSQMYIMTNYPLTTNLVFPPRENLLDNPTFDLWGRGETFSSVTVDNTNLAERWQAWMSGDTGTISRGSLDSSLSRNTPFKGKSVMDFATAGADDFAGFQTVFYNEEALRKFADQEVTISCYGVGALPSVIRLSVTMDYGSGGSADEQLPPALLANPVSSANNLTFFSGGTRTPTLEGKTVGTDPKIVFRIDTNTSEAWAFKPAAVKLEFGNGSTAILPTDLRTERAKASQYFQKRGGGSDYMVDLYRKTSTSARAVVTFQTPMVKAPDVSIVGSITNLRLDNVSSTLTPTSMSVNNLTEYGCLLEFVHPASTAYHAGAMYSNSDSTYLTIDVE